MENLSGDFEWLIGYEARSISGNGIYYRQWHEEIGETHIVLVEACGHRVHFKVDDDIGEIRLQYS